MNGVNVFQHRGGESRVQVCTGLHGPQPPPAGPSCGDWSMGAVQTLSVGPSFLLGSSGMHLQEKKKQMHSHDCSKHRGKKPPKRARAELCRMPWPHRVRTADGASPSHLHLHPGLELPSLCRAKRRGCLSKFYLKHCLVPKRQRIVVCISKRSIIGMEDS